MNPTPPLYDAHGRLIKKEGPNKAPKLTEHVATPEGKSATSREPPPDKSKKRLRDTWPTWAKGWKLFLEACTLVGLAIAVYALRPILSVTSHVGTGIDKGVAT
jgi:hypothetical protein